MIYAIAGGARMGAFQLNESLLERITRKLRDGWKRLIDVLNQPGVPKMDKTLMAIQTKFTIATFIGDEKMFREAIEAYRKWRSK